MGELGLLSVECSENESVCEMVDSLFFSCIVKYDVGFSRRLEGDQTGLVTGDMFTPSGTG